MSYNLLAILGLALLMIVHESGHFFAARAFGMRVTTFSIGFGPTFFKIIPKDGYYWFTTALGKVRLRLFRHNAEKQGPTIFQVGMIPFFAYVKIDGMNPFEEVDPKDKASYANASLAGRFGTLFAGPFANYLFASVLFFAAFMIGGRAFLPTDINVVEGRPAATAGMKDGDKIVEIAGTPVEDWERMAEIIATHPAQAIPVVVQRGQERVSLMVTTVNEGGRGKIGVAARGPASRAPVSAKEALTLAITKPPAVVKDLIIGLGQVLTRKAEGELAGPVRIVKEAAKAAESGFSDLLMLLAALSAYLGAFNLLPFPALDGGRLMFLVYEGTTRRRFNPKIEAPIHFIGFLMLMGLMLYVTVFNDVGLGAK